MTQSELLYMHLRRKPHTTMELLQLGISVAPWKRIAEGTHHLRPGERIEKSWRKTDGLVTYAVVKD